MLIQVKSKNKLKKRKSVSVMHVCYFLLFTVFSLDFEIGKFVFVFLGLICTCFVAINSPDRADKTFFSYQKRLHYVDVKLGVKSSKYMGDFNFFSYILFLVVYQFAVCQMYCLIGNACQPVILSLTFVIPTLSSYTTHVIFFFIFYFPYMRLVQLKKCIEAGSLAIRHSHCLYRSLINSTEQVLEGFKLIFSMSVVVLHNITVSVSFVIKFLPCITTSMLYHKAGHIKVILHDKLLEERDQVRAQEIERFISYIEARPFQFYVLLLIPMDSTLPLILFNLSVTYFIVVIRLTHLV